MASRLIKVICKEKAIGNRSLFDWFRIKAE